MVRYFIKDEKKEDRNSVYILGLPNINSIYLISFNLYTQNMISFLEEEKKNLIYIPI